MNYIVQNIDKNDITISIEKMLSFEEGKKLKAYNDSLGILTVGIGHNLKSNPALSILKRKINLGECITEQECSELFDMDLKAVINSINANFTFFDTLKDKYKIVIINMVFQLGMGGTKKFKNAINNMIKDNLSGVTYGMKNSQWAKQTPDRVNRLIDMLNDKIPSEYIL